ncbi:hypothetical protein GCM10010156_27560 [Planobispora rosea]|nr:hypothetical protein GCM10010156_27560 [Planobispora rosea]
MAEKLPTAPASGITIPEAPSANFSEGEPLKGASAAITVGSAISPRTLPAIPQPVSVPARHTPAIVIIIPRFSMAGY